MDNINKYIIPITGLSEGTHEFSFSIGKDFFDLFEESELHDGQVEIHVSLFKTTEMLDLDFELNGNIMVECDRCLDIFALPVDFQAKLIVEFGDENSDVSDADEKITLSRKENNLDLAQHFYDYINLSLPIRRIHPKDENNKSTCNKEMLKKLKELSSGDNEIDTDPRWDNLKPLMN